MMNEKSIKANENLYWDEKRKIKHSEKIKDWWEKQNE